MKTFAAAVGALLVLFVNLVAGCGQGTVTFGGGGGGNGKYKVTVTGNLDAITPVTSRNIVVFAYTIAKNSENPGCPCPGDPTPAAAGSNTTGKAVVLTSGQSTFTLSGLDPGPVGVVFLLDKAGNAADGQIDPGDEIAILDDVNCSLDSVAGNMTVTLKDVDLWFASTQVNPTTTTTMPDDSCKSGKDGPPEQQRARARLISVATTKAAK